MTLLRALPSALVELIHPPENAGHNDGERHDHRPGIDTQQSRNRQLAVIAKLEQIALNERMNFRIEAGTDQDA
jgi:hypothetical protein